MSRKKVVTISSAHEKMTFINSPFMQLEQFKLNKIFRQYIETIMILPKVLRMEIQKNRFKKYTKLLVCKALPWTLGSNRQFDFLKFCAPLRTKAINTAQLTTVMM